MPENKPVVLSLPKYRSHKEVWAAKLASVERMKDGSAILEPEEQGCMSFRVSPAYVEKHDPQPGGYYVLYEGDYESWSPAEAFEQGYTRI